MLPQGRSGSLESGARRGCARLLAALLAALVCACDTATWPAREAKVIDNPAVDSSLFVPAGSRFVLADSATRILFKGFHKGFACTRVLDLGIVKDTVLAGYRPRLVLQLPADAACPFDSLPRDTVLIHVFSSGEDTVRLLNSQGLPDDSARVVRGLMHVDSLIYDSSLTGTVSKGRFTYRDTSSFLDFHLDRQLFADSLSPCEALNQAEYVKTGDTTRVRYTWVTLDSCGGESHSDSLPVLPARL